MLKAKRARVVPPSQEGTLVRQIQAAGLPEPVREYVFDGKRRWRFDLAWPALMIAVEVEGGIYTGGRHVRPVGFVNDMAKYNAAAEAGWTLFRVTPRMVRDREALGMVERAMKKLHGD